MVRTSAVLYSALLFQLTSVANAAALTPSSDQEGKQCLMQKAHTISRLNKVDVNPNLEQVLGAKDPATGLTQSSTQQRPRPQSKSKSKKGGKRPRRSPALTQTSVQQRPRSQGKHKSKKGGKRPRRTLHVKALGKGFAQKGDGWFKSTKKTKVAGLVQVGASRMNPALELLPEPVLALARKLFKSEDAIAGCIENSVLMDITYAGVKMSLRLNKFDDATKRLGEEAQWFGYDLDTLGDVLDNSGDMLNMIDVGGNYGVVTIAAMKKYAHKLRVIAVEPIPETFFFLTWNLYINGIPILDEATMKDKDGKRNPGVLALNSGSGDVGGQDLHFCAYPWSSMNSKMCDCPRGEDNCHIVPSVAVNDLVAMFGSDPIAMVKMDCEGCEFKSLPALGKKDISKRVRRLAGELHLPDKNLEEIACRWDDGRLLTKCQQGQKGKDDIECGVKLSC